MGEYCVAQLCLKGHVITSVADRQPEKLIDFCEKCGSETTMSCQHCGAKIRGKYIDNFDLALFESDLFDTSSSDEMKIPMYCSKCGKEYPWTQLIFGAIAEVLYDDEKLSNTEKDELIATLPDIVHMNPKTKSAIHKFKKIIGKATSYTAEAIKDVVVEIGAESIKRSLFP